MLLLRGFAAGFMVTVLVALATATNAHGTVFRAGCGTSMTTIFKPIATGAVAETACGAGSKARYLSLSIQEDEARTLVNVTEPIVRGYAKAQVLTAAMRPGHTYRSFFLLSDAKKTWLYGTCWPSMPF